VTAAVSGSKLAAFAALALAGLGWSLGFPLGKLALREVSPAHLILWRFLFASIAALPFALTRKARALFANRWVVLAGIFYGLAFVIQFRGLAEVTVALAALLVGTMPALVAVSAWALREPVSRTTWGGVAAATLGGALIAGKPEGAGTPLGIALSLVSLLVFLVWLLCLRRAPATHSALAVSAVTLIVATITVAPVAIAMDGVPDLALSLATWAGLVGLGIVATFVATYAWGYGAARVGSASAGVFINIEPLVGAIIGVALFHDPAGAALIGGGVLIILGSLAVVRGESRAAA
jgi:drug/metabolite transporter (DMT)-like permease